MEYTEKQLRHIRKGLIAERDRLREESLSIEKRSSAADESDLIGELVDYDENHPAELASETYEREKDFAFSENVSELMMKVERALEKLDEGTYGICDRCNSAINPQRTHVLPSATMCVKCQDAIEGR
jgi:RNA polymerase-binding transcription factor DksA